MNIPITEYYDDDPIITEEKIAENKPEQIARRARARELGVKTAIITWIDDKSPAAQEVLRDAEPFHQVYGSSGRMPVYLYRKKYLLAFALVGAPYAAGAVEELRYYGVENFIAFGTAGLIDPDFDSRKMVIVERAIRDEGVSYHYVPPSVYVETAMAITSAIETVLARHDIPAQRGITWTTDSFFRETHKRTAKRREQGAVCVEMECAAFAAACKHHGLRFGQFLFFSDAVCADRWKWVMDSKKRSELKSQLIQIGVEIAELI